MRSAQQLTEIGTIRCAVYGRYSSELQRATSIEDQIRQCRNHAKHEGWEVLEDFVLADKALSGATMAGREALDKLVTAAKTSPRPFDCLLIDDTSRLGRNIADVLKIGDIFRFYGVFLFFVSQKLDSRNESFRQLHIFSGMMDEQYLVGLRDKVHRGQEGRVLNGYHPGGKCYGYQNVPELDPTRKSDYGRVAVTGVKLAIIEEQAAIVRRIFEMYADGYGLARIAKQLNKDGIQSPQPPRKSSARAWCPSGIRDMLRNQRYIGKVRWNRTTKIRNPETGHRTQRRKSKAEELIVDAPEQRIVPQELWERVQLRIAEISKRFTGRQMGGMNRTERSRTYLFSGLLVCGMCGANMVITGGTKNNAKYACPLHRYRGVCTNNLYIRRDRLEDQLLTALTDKLRQPDVLECIVKRFGEQLEDRLNEIRTSRQILSKAELHDQMKELRVQEGNLADAIARHGLSDVLSARLKAVENRIGEINRTLHCPEIESTFNLSPDEQREFVLQRADNFAALLRADPLIERRTLRQHITKLNWS
jgi:DNA invertase Pin-like site-specific DNA recombinase